VKLSVVFQDEGARRWLRSLDEGQSVLPRPATNAWGHGDTDWSFFWRANRKMKAVEEMA
jgi:hypothetical protein